MLLSASIVNVLMCFSFVRSVCRGDHIHHSGRRNMQENSDGFCGLSGALQQLAVVNRSSARSRLTCRGAVSEWPTVRALQQNDGPLSVDYLRLSGIFRRTSSKKLSRTVACSDPPLASTSGYGNIATRFPSGETS